MAISLRFDIAWKSSDPRSGFEMGIRISAANQGLHGEEAFAYGAVVLRKWLKPR